MRGAPQSVFSMLIRRIRARRPASIVAGLPGSGTSGANSGGGPDGRHCLHDRWKPPIQLEEEQAIAVRKLDPTAHLALKHDQLTSERGVLSLKPADRPEGRNR